MANPNISPSWTHQLTGTRYKVDVSLESPLDFFGYDPDDSDALLDSIDPNLVSGPLDQYHANLSPQTSLFLDHLDYASSVNVIRETAADDFLGELLDVAGYEEYGLRLRHCQNISLAIYDGLSPQGRLHNVQANLCLVKRYTVLLVVLQTPLEHDPHSPVIAAAIAAFQTNNRERGNVGLPPLDEMVVPCIAMTGTRPAFYKVPVTTALNYSVVTSHYATATTNVVCCRVPPRRATEGMESPIYRKKALKHIVAFRGLAKSLWQNFLVQ